MAAETNQATNGAGAAAVSARKDDWAVHALPPWMDWVRDHVLVVLLTLGDAYLLGTMFSLGLVSNLDDPRSWGIYEGVGVAIFFGAGIACAGIGIGCSAAAPVFFRRGGFKNYVAAVINLTLMLLFFAAELWVSFYERAQHLLPTPADETLLSILHVPAGFITFSPTVVVGAFIFQLAIFAYGVSKVPGDEAPKKKVLQDPDELRREQELALIKAQGEAAIRAVKAGGLAAAGRAAINAARGKVDEPAIAADMAAEGDTLADIAPEGDRMGDEGASEGEAPARRTVAGERLPSGDWWSLADVLRYARLRDVVLDDDKNALRQIEAQIKAKGNGQKADRQDGRPGKPGTPYIAPRSSLRPWLLAQPFFREKLPTTATGTGD